MKIVDNLTDDTANYNTKTLKITPSDYIYYDFTKTHATKEELERLKEEMIQKGLNSKIKDMWDGKNINFTENRPVMHFLLRDKNIISALRGYCSKLNDNVIQESVKKFKETKNQLLSEQKIEILEEFKKMADFSKDFHDLRGITGKSFDTIVNVGIGGSDLGPRMVTDSLQAFSNGKKVFFISNVDPSDTIKTLRSINLEKTLFIIVSKTFTTIETIENFKLILSIFVSSFENKYSEKDICNKHFVAVSSNIDETKKYGIARTFSMWDFVGGRYSLWSAVGLSICLYIGFENFVDLLEGASSADEEFYKNKEDSISARMAANELFYIHKGFNNKCIVSYDSYLGLFYKYLQQAEMESNGKHGSKQMIIWGGVGTDVQHSFFQFLHQGSQNIYLEFLCPLKNVKIENSSVIKDNNTYNIELGIHQSADQISYHHNLLLASCFAQSRSLLVGKHSDDLNHHFPGDKPSTTILYSMLSPKILGALLAVYEHKIFVEGVYFGINSFDQYGVQLGKTITNELIKHMIDDSENKEELDLSTKALIGHVVNKKAHQ